MEQAQVHIRTAEAGEAPVLADIIRRSFADVAQRFHLTPENCPKHPSNCTDNWVRNDLARGVTYYLLARGQELLGCAALEKADPDTCYLERLAVLPAHRRQGLGQRLVERVIAQAGSLGAKRLGIGIIAEQDELRSWYKGLGFVETGTRRFEHLPFTVAFLEYEIAG